MSSLTRTMNAAAARVDTPGLVLSGAVSVGISWVIHYAGARIGKLPPTSARQAAKGGAILTAGVVVLALVLVGASGGGS